MSGKRAGTENKRHTIASQLLPQASNLWFLQVNGLSLSLNSSTINRQRFVKKIPKDCHRDPRSSMKEKFHGGSRVASQELFSLISLAHVHISFYFQADAHGSVGRD